MSDPTARPVSDDARRKLEDLERELASQPPPKPMRPIEPHDSDKVLAKANPKKDIRVRRDDDRVAEPLDLEPRSFTSKLLGIGIVGWLRLLAICVLAGVVLQASGINPFDPEFTWQGGLGALWQGTLSVLAWSVNNGWRPLLAGALVILPVWFVFRLVTVPFRK